MNVDQVRCSWHLASGLAAIRLDVAGSPMDGKKMFIAAGMPLEESGPTNYLKLRFSTLDRVPIIILTQDNNYFTDYLNPRLAISYLCAIVLQNPTRDHFKLGKRKVLARKLSNCQFDIGQFDTAYNLTPDNLTPRTI